MTNELKDALQRLEKAIEKVDGALDVNKVDVMRRQRDLFDAGVPSVDNRFNVKAIASKLDQTIHRVEGLLKEAA